MTTTPADATQGPPLGGRLQRLMAQLVDGGAFIACLWPLLFAPGVRDGSARAALWTVGGLGLTLLVALNLRWLARDGQTLGKRLAGLRIRGRDGAPVSLGRVVLRRWLPFHLPALLPGVWPLLSLLDAAAIFRPSRACWHDDLAKTRVERSPARVGAGLRRGAIALGLLLHAAFVLGAPVEAWVYEGPSMEPTLLDGDRVVTFNLRGADGVRLLRGGLLPEESVARGDVVVVASPPDDVTVIKRVVAVGGDVVTLRGGELWLDGEPLVANGLGRCERGSGRLRPGCRRYRGRAGGRGFELSYARKPQGELRVQVPPGEVFLLGDHLDASNDSRNPAIGTVGMQRVIGVVRYRYFGRRRDGGVDLARIFDRL